MPDGKVSPDNYRGWLYKWTNYIKGYQKRWFVLSNGLLSYYRTQAEMAHTCRGTINLASATVDTLDSCSFVIGKGGTQTYYLRAANEVDRQKWVTALGLAQAKAIKMLESSDDEGEPRSPVSETVKALKALGEKAHELKTYNELVSKHAQMMYGIIAELDRSAAASGTSGKQIQEKATLFKISASGMVNACGEFLNLARSYEGRWQKTFEAEREQRRRLEETVESLAREHNRLEERCMKESTSTGNLAPSNIDEEDGEEEEENEDDSEFFDAEENLDETISTSEPPPKDVSIFIPGHSRSVSDVSVGAPSPAEMNEPLGPLSPVMEPTVAAVAAQKLSGVSGNRALIPPFTLSDCDVGRARKRRVVIAPKPNCRLNLWSLMKNCIGRELSKIPLPVNINEPLSFTQRIVEDLEYADILIAAAKCDNSLEQLAHVAAFTISSYANTSARTGKPFNPMLGETFEFDDTGNTGWRALAEQVGHHPPETAMHAEHKEWLFWQDYIMGSKFRGQYLQIIPQGCAHLIFHRTGNHYFYKRGVISTVHNIIVGRLYVDQAGEFDIVNHTTNEKCHIKYYPYSYFSREEPKKVTAVVCDAHNIPRYYVFGTWDKQLQYAKIRGNLPVYTPTTKRANIQTETPILIWQRTPPKPTADTMYGLNAFACSLNEPEEGIASTDSRLRPDQRLMEDGDYDSANGKKLELEEKQRARRREREARLTKEWTSAGHKDKPPLGPDVGWTATWFKKEVDPLTNLPTHTYKGGYWEMKKGGEWNGLPVIF